jgi:PA domain
MRSRSSLTLVLLAVLAAASVNGAATIVIQNADPANVGFNDPTVVAPVGGNTGTTLGQQRLIAFQAAASKWGATVTSATTIRIRAVWTALTCTATSAVLGSAGATEIFANGSLPVASRWFGKAEANMYAGSDLDSTTADISANFNVNLGNTGCLTGTFFYLGLDGNHGANVDLVTVLTHEFAHGLGFQTYTNGSTGAQISGLPSIWDDYLFDTTTGKVWSVMTNAERAASAVKNGKLVWLGTNVTSALPGVLQAGTPLLSVSAPASVAGSYAVGVATFGSALSSPGVTAQIQPFVDTAPNLGLACSAFTSQNAALIAGKIVLLDRGVCNFTVKVKNAQLAGAVGVIIADNVAGSPPSGLSGTDTTITIPSVRITQADGAALKAAAVAGSRNHSGLSGTLGLNLAVFSGADPAGHILMYAPNPYQGGSSVSHFDVSAFPNQLMEPAINGDLTHEVIPPHDLTFKLLKDIGWN